MLYDKDIREPLFMYFEEKYGKTRVFEEKRMGNSRADILIITEKDFIGIEIKAMPILMQDCPAGLGL